MGDRGSKFLVLRYARIKEQRVDGAGYIIPIIVFILNTIIGIV